MFSLFEVLFPLMFILVLGIIVFQLFQGISTWNKNNNSPRLTVDATVVAKRANVTHHNHTDANGMNQHSGSFTTYYVTFQVESGDRMELSMSGSEYGMLAEGDFGKLTFQGTRYLEFAREMYR